MYTDVHFLKCLFIRLVLIQTCTHSQSGDLDDEVLDAGQADEGLQAVGELSQELRDGATRLPLLSPLLSLLLRLALHLGGLRGWEEKTEGRYHIRHVFEMCSDSLNNKALVLLLLRRPSYSDFISKQ